MIKIAICDDNVQTLKIVESEMNNIIQDFINHSEIKVFSSSSQLIEIMEKEEFDALFLDIDMPEKTGIQVAEIAVDKYPNTNIIFLTNREDLVFEAIHYHPFRFIRKEKMYDELPEAVYALSQKILTDMLLYEFKNGSGGKKTVKLPIRDIIYLEASGHYIMVHTNTDQSIIRGKMNEYEIELEKYGFIRVHSGYIVNVRFIYSVGSEGVLLDNDELIPISRKNIGAVREKHLRFIGRFVHGNNR